MTEQITFNFERATAPAAWTPEQRVIAANPDRYADDFWPWLAENWHIWREFRRQADLVWDRGWQHYSARTIIHWIRHHTALAERGTGEPWKVNNNWSPDLARLYADLYPSRANLFEYRAMNGSSKRDE